MSIEEAVLMLNNPTVDKLLELKLKVMAKMFSEPDFELRELSFEERFGIMVEREWISKKNSKIKRLLNSASFPIAACVEDINYLADRTIDKKTVSTLATCMFIEHKLNVIISGKTGSGKSYLCCALGNAACRKGYTVKYYRIPELLLEIEEAKSENKYSKFMDKLQKVNLLILDDIGLKSYTLEESRDIMEIAEARCNKGPTMLSGQVAHEKWYELFPDPTVADGIMDRLVHNSYIIELNSKRSMRAVVAEKIINDMNMADISK